MQDILANGLLQHWPPNSHELLGLYVAKPKMPRQVADVDADHWHGVPAASHGNDLNPQERRDDSGEILILILMGRA